MVELIIQNIIKALNKLTDSTEKDENIRNLLNFIIQIKNNVSHVETNEINDEIVLNNEDLINTTSNATLQILFKGAIKKIYDIPIYLFRFRDIMNNEDGYKEDVDHNNDMKNTNHNTHMSSYKKNIPNQMFQSKLSTNSRHLLTQTSIASTVRSENQQKKKEKKVKIYKKNIIIKLKK